LKLADQSLLLFDTVRVKSLLQRQKTVGRDTACKSYSLHAIGHLFARIETWGKPIRRPITTTTS
jgi:hypothetical protein